MTTYGLQTATWEFSLDPNINQKFPHLAAGSTITVLPSGPATSPLQAQSAHENGFNEAHGPQRDPMNSPEELTDGTTKATLVHSGFAYNLNHTTSPSRYIGTIQTGERGPTQTNLVDYFPQSDDMETRLFTSAHLSPLDVITSCLKARPAKQPTIFRYLSHPLSQVHDINAMDRYKLCKPCTRIKKNITAVKNEVRLVLKTISVGGYTCNDLVGTGSVESLDWVTYNKRLEDYWKTWGPENMASTHFIRSLGVSEHSRDVMFRLPLNDNKEDSQAWNDFVMNLFGTMTEEEYNTSIKWLSYCTLDAAVTRINSSVMKDIYSGLDPVLEIKDSPLINYIEEQQLEEFVKSVTATAMLEMGGTLSCGHGDVELTSAWFIQKDGDPEGTIRHLTNIKACRRDPEGSIIYSADVTAYILVSD